MLPLEVGLPSFRISQFDPIENDQLMKEELDLLSEVRLQAELKIAAQKDRMSKAFNKRVNHRVLEVGDLVLRRTAATGKYNV